MYNPYDYYITPEEYEIAASNGISRRCLEDRIRRCGWGKKKAITQPKQRWTDHKMLAELARSNGISYRQLKTRLYLGWNELRAATTPIRDKEMLKDHIIRIAKARRIFPAEMVSLAKQNGVCYVSFWYRIKRSGWDYERAATLPPSRLNGIMRLKEIYGEDHLIKRADRVLKLIYWDKKR